MSRTEEQRVAKRQRIDGPSAKRQGAASRIFAPFRTVGLISPTPVPFTSVPLGKTTFQLTTSTGRALQTFDLRRGLQLVFLTRPQTPGQITATYAWKGVVLAAWQGHGIWVFRRGQKIAELALPSGLEHAGPITRLQVLGTWLVAVTGARIDVWRNASESGAQWEYYTMLQGIEGDFTGALCSVPTLLNKILAGKRDGSVEIWNVRSGKLVYTIQPPSLKSGAVSAIEPSTAIGVVAIARADGSVLLHDAIKDRTILRVKSDVQVTSISFRTDGAGAGDDGQKDGVMATAGTDSGDITLWDLNDGGRIQGVLRNAHNPPSSAAGAVSGGISRIQFLAGQPVIVSSGLDNALKTWVFDQSPFNPVPRILHSRSGHAAPVTRLQFLPTQTDGSDAIGKWLLSSGRDRSLWGWSLRRDGQSTEISQGNVKKKAKKLGFDGKKLAMDTSTALEDLKAPEITCLACNLNRDGGMGASTGGGAVWANVSKKQADPHAPATGWESMVTGHRGDKYARTWFWGRKKAGRWAFETGDKTEVTSVAMSPCGTFALVGSAGGAIDMFNLQSGMHRQKFPRRLTPAELKAIKLRQKAAQDNGDDADGAENEDAFSPEKRGRHTRDVTGLVVDSMNRTVISSSLDGTVRFWDFHTGTLKHTVDKSLSGGLTMSRYHRPSDLIAFACDDTSIQVLDIETRKTVRELWGCAGQIKDLCFSADGRWIVAASSDAVVRVWDLPTSNLIDAFKLNSVCTSLALSPTNEFLATAHADGIGIAVWSNRALFRRVPTRRINETAVQRALMPGVGGDGAQGGVLAAAFEEADIDDDDAAGDAVVPAPSNLDQLAENMTTLSLVPRSRWQTLLHLDLIAQRNKPIEAPKAPERAPFFLPAVGGSTRDGSNPAASSSALTNGTSGASGDAEADLGASAGERSRISALQRHAAGTSSRPFNALLHAFACAGAGDGSTAGATTAHEAVVAHLKTLAPAAADVEIRSLRLDASAADGSDVNELAAFVDALTARLSQRRDYEVVHAWMAVFLKIHADVVALPGDSQHTLRARLRAWKEVAVEERRRLGALVGFCGGVVGFLRSGR